jgi:putative RNA 2'-phosphotransferase
MEKHLVRISKFLSLVLRHKPQTIGLALDDGGWAQIDELIVKARGAGINLTEELLHQVVEQNDKKRFALSEDRLRIRASQGHSIAVSLELEPQEPPDLLYHGTASRFIASIRASGLVRGQRNHVHLSKDERTAVGVGKRHGKPAVLVIKAGRMHESGFQFFLSANGVWLTERVPIDYIVFPEE